MRRPYPISRLDHTTTSQLLFLLLVIVAKLKRMGLKLLLRQQVVIVWRVKIHFAFKVSKVDQINLELQVGMGQICSPHSWWRLMVTQLKSMVIVAVIK